MQTTRHVLALRHCVAGLCLVLLGACGGSGGPDVLAAGAGVQQQAAAGEAIYRPQSLADGARFLTQATFGPTSADTSAVSGVSYNEWIDQQLAMPLSESYQSIGYTRKTISPTSEYFFTHTFWQKALSAQDQLRQRMAFALSQIFVVSFQDNCGAATGLGMESYYDTLVTHAFGSYRDLLKSVALHPIMGCYLSHIKNRKADPVSGRVPDENFAREIMQLFSIGLLQLNNDGTLKLDGSGQAIETYSAGDVAEMARVFTGFSWDCSGAAEATCFESGNAVARTDGKDPWTLPMKAYATYHDGGAKTLLGKAIPASTNPATTLDAAIDILASHPNVAPFISKQLIQRFVTSNPSPAYVRRVAQKFKDTNGNLGLTVRAILLDSEARDMAAAAANNNFGKVREPVLRLSAFLRAMGPNSATGNYTINSTKEAASGLAQSPLDSPSVFNFYRPGYVLPSEFSTGVLSPEMQLADETSMAGYAAFMRDVISVGVGGRITTGNTWYADVRPAYVRDSGADPLVSTADDPALLVDEVDRRLTWGQMSPELKQEITSVVRSINFVNTNLPSDQQASQRSTQRFYRTKAALLLAVVSPEFLIQK
jgi:uncharacterized protein (DUF1800 family)